MSFPKKNQLDMIVVKMVNMLIRKNEQQQRKDIEAKKKYDELKSQPNNKKFNMGLFTFIMEYLGGTYISQVKARDKEQARDIWIRNLEVKEIKFFTIKDQQNIIKDNFADNDIVPIKETNSVWFFMVETKKGFGYVNLIKTKL